MKRIINDYSRHQPCIGDNVIPTVCGGGGGFVHLPGLIVVGSTNSQSSHRSGSQRVSVQGLPLLASKKLVQVPGGQGL